jgi:uncharacterized protein
MSERTEYAPGTPSWVDVTAPDVAATRAFYEGLFGWEGHDLGAEAGGYVMWHLRGKIVAACTPLTPEMQANGVPPAWTTYVSVESADATAEAAAAAGGAVMMPPFDVFEAGRMAVLRDPTGGVVAIWQPGTTKGAELVNEPGALAWNELLVRDADTALAFYGAVFGWTTKEEQVMPPPMPPYILLLVGDAMVAGCLRMGDEFPPEVPTFWLPYFGVADTDASVARARELGGDVRMEPVDIPPGRFAVCSDPAGATFGVIAIGADAP